MSNFSWAVGLTTVSERKDTTLPRTLASLKAAGWSEVRLFVDGCSQGTVFQEPVTFRWPRIGAWANWHLGLLELHLREPNADAYMMVQDDVVFCKNVRQHLERTMPRSKSSWLNLYTVDQNESVISNKPIGWHEAASLVGQGANNRQVNKGALALVFSNQAVESLLSHSSIVSKCRGSKPKTNIDGTVGTALNALGHREMIHNPSLVDHIGGDCSIIERQIEQEVKDKKRAHVRATLPKCLSFRGEEFDCLNLP